MIGFVAQPFVQFAEWTLAEQLREFLHQWQAAGQDRLVAGTVGNWPKRSRAYLEVERYVSGVLLIGLGLTVALAGSQKR